MIFFFPSMATSHRPWRIQGEVKKVMKKSRGFFFKYVGWQPPSQVASDHQDCFMFRIGEFRTKPSFATITGKGDNPNKYDIQLILRTKRKNLKNDWN